MDRVCYNRLKKETIQLVTRSSCAKLLAYLLVKSPNPISRHRTRDPTLTKDQNILDTNAQISLQPHHPYPGYLEFKIFVPEKEKMKKGKSKSKKVRK